MNARIDSMIHKAFFISPIVDMEKLICDKMQWANVTEAELKSKGVIRIDRQHGLHTLEHAEEIGLGSRLYTLVNIDG